MVESSSYTSNTLLWGPVPPDLKNMYKEAGCVETKLSKFGFCPRARAQAEVKSPAIHILRPNDVLTIHFALAVLQEDNSVVTSGTSGPVLYRGSGGDMEEVGFECVENIILNGQFSDYIVVCQGREYKCHLV